MAGLVPATHKRGRRKVRGGAATAHPEPSACMGPRDKPGDDGPRMEGFVWFVWFVDAKQR